MAAPLLVVVDDDVDDLELFKTEFEQRCPGSWAHYLEGGQQLRAYLAECREAELPSVLLVDYKMNDVSGPEILEFLLSDSKFAPIVKMVWSTSGRSEDQARCKRLGAAKYIIKPGSNHELAELVEQVSGYLHA